MKKMSETIVFFGSGPVAAKCLDLLVNDFEVEAVITKPKPEHHMYDFPVIEKANALELQMFEAEDKAGLDNLFKSSPVKSHLGVVIDYGVVISQSVIDQFALGIVNSHFSLLPKLRGPDPISFAILEGHQTTGVSLMLINNKLDEGDLLAQAPFKLSNDITTPTLTDKLISLSHSLLVDALPKYIDGRISAKPQSGAASYTRKLTRADSHLDWQKPAEELEREIRAFIDWPRSRASIASHQIIVTKAHVLVGNGQPGTLWRQANEFGVYTSKGVLVIDRLIPAGKKEMSGSDFLLGYNLGS